MDAHTVALAALISFLGGLLQGTVGFGFGLLCVPLLISIGLPVPAVLAMSAVCTAVQAASGVHHLRHCVPWKMIGMSFVVRVAAMTLGIWLLRSLVSHPIAQIKFWVGLVVLLLIVLQICWRPRPRAKLHPLWNLAAFAGSGFTTGLCAMGGPPLVQWVMAHDWSADKTRAFLFASFMVLVPVQLAQLYGSFGSLVTRGMIFGAALTPVVLLGSLLGLRMGSRFSKPFLCNAAFVLLTVVALNAMTTQVLLWLTASGRPT